jgi:hypothetical protein
MKKLAIILLLILLSACIRSETTLKTLTGGAPDEEELGQIAESLPDIQENVTIHKATDLVPEAENPFLDII